MIRGHAQTFFIVEIAHFGIFFFSFDWNAVESSEKPIAKRRIENGIIGKKKKQFEKFSLPQRLDQMPSEDDSTPKCKDC